MDFTMWLQNKMDEHGWNQSQLAQRSGISQGQIAHILAGKREPGPKVCRAFARAMNLPEEEVFRAAGLLSNNNGDRPPTLGEWIHIFMTATPEERDNMLDLARYLSRKK